MGMCEIRISTGAGVFPALVRLFALFEREPEMDSPTV